MARYFGANNHSEVLMELFKEFKAFVARGNVVDMAVGVIIGTAFGTIVTSLVRDIVMPPIGLLLGGVDFSHLSLIVGADQKTGDDVAIKYGMFLSTIVNFFIIAFVIFLFTKVIYQLKTSGGVIDKKECPECLSSIPINARRCAHCTSTITNKT